LRLPFPNKLLARCHAGADALRIAGNARGRSLCDATPVLMQINARGRSLCAANGARIRPTQEWSSAFHRCAARSSVAFGRKVATSTTMRYAAPPYYAARLSHSPPCLAQANRSSIYSATPGQSTQDKALKKGLTAVGTADSEADAQATERRAAALERKAQAEAKLRAAAKSSKL
jgi:hypothetical protein